MLRKNRFPEGRSWSGEPRTQGYCYRSLVETLATTAVRISEVLALNRDSIDVEKREARIIGKGNKERTVFFTVQAIQWIQRYLALRRDSNATMFASSSGSRLLVNSVESMFRRLRMRAGLEKPVPPHVLRHTAATNLLRNGCPLGHIKEVLGHERFGA